MPGTPQQAQLGCLPLWIQKLLAIWQSTCQQEGDSDPSKTAVWGLKKKKLPDRELSPRVTSKGGVTEAYIINVRAERVYQAIASPDPIPPAIVHRP